MFFIRGRANVVFILSSVRSEVRESEIKMHSLSNMCSLCLEDNKNVLSPINIDSSVQELIQYIIPEYVFQTSAIPKQICDNCLNTLNTILTFRYRCLQNIVSFNEYVLKLPQELGAAAIDTSNHKISEIFCKKINDIEDKTTNTKCAASMNNEICETNDFNSYTEDLNENKKIEQVLIKVENTMRDFNDESEMNEEVTTEKSYSEPFLQEDYCETNIALKNDSHTIPTCNHEADYQIKRDVICERQIQPQLQFDGQMQIKELSYEGQAHENHNVVQRHICEICGKTFSLARTLVAHKRIHSVGKPFTCDVCHKKFCLISQLNMHYYKHTGNKPFSCDICKKKFVQSNTLKIHKLTHTGVKPFKCEVCGKAFTQAGGVKTHHKRFHTAQNPSDQNNSYLPSSGLK